MKIDRKALKTGARLALRRQTGHSPAGVTAVYLLVTGGAMLALNLISEHPMNRLVQMLRQGVAPGRALALTVAAVGTAGLFVSMLLLLSRLVADIGYAGWGLRVSRGEKTGVAALLDGLSMVGRVLLLNIAVAVLCLCWYVVLLLPVLSLALSASYLPGGPVLATLLAVAGAILFLLCVLRYAMAEFCLLDEPAKGVFFALRSSRLLMRGRSPEYAVLMLSFLGWILLAGVASSLAESACILAMGGTSAVLSGDMEQVLRLSGHPVVTVVSTLAGWAVSLWVQPYLTVTQASYYHFLREQKEI